MNVSHNEKEGRFECDVDGGTALCAYRRDGDRIVLTHTEVPPEAEGGGVASKLVASALAYARENELKVVPQCAFAVGYVRRHPEWEDVVETE